MKRIEITVSPTGETTIQTKGFTGGECQLATKDLEKALGVVASDVKTPEFYATRTQEQHLTQG